MKKKFTTLLILFTLPVTYLFSTGSLNKAEYDQMRAKFESYAAQTAGQSQWLYIFPNHLPDLFAGEGNTANMETMRKKAGIRDGGQLTEVLGEEWISAWQNSDNEFYTYDQNDFLVEMLFKEWEGAAWVNASDYFYTNNASGQPAEVQIYMWDTDLGSWQLFAKATYTYNLQGNVTEILMEVWVDPIWMGFARAIYTYTNNQVSEILNLTFDFMTKSWINSSKELFTYNGSGWVIEELSQDWVNNAWENGEKETLTYNGYGQHIHSLVLIWMTGAWENYLYYLYTYNGNGYLAEEIEQDWDGSAWINYYKYQHSYDGYWNLSQVLELTWNNNAWENAYRSNYFYGPVGITEQGSDDYNYSINTYPNPFVNRINLEYTLAQTATVSGYLYDLSGKKIDMVIPEEVKLPGAYNATWAPKAELEKGVYLLTVTVNGNSRSYKVVKN